MSKRRLQVLHAAFYWSGVLLAVACGSIIMVAHTTLFHSSEHMPSSLVLGGLAILAFAASEAFNAALAKRKESVDTPKSVQQVSPMHVDIPRWLPVEPDSVERDSRELLPDQIAALTEAMDLLDEVRERVSSHDIPAAMPLISDTRQRIASLVSGSYRHADLPVSRPARA